MADSGINAIEKALRSALNTAGLIALVPQARHWNMLVPPASTFPALVFSMQDNDATGRAFGQDAMAFDYLVKGITKGGTSGADAVETAGDIAQQIDLALHNTTMTPTGYTKAYKVQRQRWVRYTEYDEGRVPYVHCGAVYRVWVY